MRKISTKNFLKILFLPILLLAVGLCFFVETPHTALADTSIALPEIKDTEERFVITPTAFSKNGKELEMTTHEVVPQVGNPYEYCVFKWRDISHITFNFSVNLQGSTKAFASYSFVVRNVQTENYDTDIGKMDTRDLISGNISNNRVTIPNFHYYFDTRSETTETAVRKVGNDFGLYKFEFSYTYWADSSAITNAVGSLYVALTPDDVNDVMETINVDDLDINYEVGSSNRLMSIYNLSLSLEENFKYINPSLIEWTAEGKSKDNVEYVLSQQMKDENPTKYINYRVIWKSQMPTEPRGVNFVFDSNNIEGKWTIYCTIYDSDHNQLASVKTAELSTIKTPAKSYLWVVILVASLIIATGVVILVVYKKKNNSKT